MADEAGVARFDELMTALKEAFRLYLNQGLRAHEGAKGVAARRVIEILGAISTIPCENTRIFGCDPEIAGRIVFVMIDGKIGVDAHKLRSFINSDVLPSIHPGRTLGLHPVSSLLNSSGLQPSNRLNLVEERLGLALVVIE